MPDIIHSSEKQNNWDRYWSYCSVDGNLKFCDTDDLLPIFEHFLLKDGIILEAGCGLAKWVIYFQRRGFHIIGIDDNVGCLKKVKEYEGQARLIAGSVTALPIRGRSIAAYISLGVIEHFQQGPQGALKEAHRVLKEGGLAIVEVPYFNLLRQVVFPGKAIFRLIRRILKLEPKDYYFSEYRYTSREIKGFLKKAGFEVLFVAPKDDVLSNRNIGLWLDFYFVRAKSKDETLYELNKLGHIFSRVLRALSPWISCACIVCVARLNIDKETMPRFYGCAR